VLASFSSEVQVASIRKGVIAFVMEDGIVSLLTDLVSPRVNSCEAALANVSIDDKVAY
jgi:hypothetical protein